MSTAIAIPTHSRLVQHHSSTGPRPKFNIRVQTFINEYLKSGNATKAALAAGYSLKGSHTQGSRLLKNAAIAAEIEALRIRTAEMAGLGATYVVESIRAIAEDDGTRPADKLRAYELLGKHLNLFAERKEIDQRITITVERVGG